MVDTATAVPPAFHASAISTREQKTQITKHELQVTRERERKKKVLSENRRFLRTKSCANNGPVTSSPVKAKSPTKQPGQRVGRGEEREESEVYASGVSLRDTTSKSLSSNLSKSRSRISSRISHLLGNLRLNFHHFLDVLDLKAWNLLAAKFAELCMIYYDLVHLLASSCRLSSSFISFPCLSIFSTCSMKSQYTQWLLQDGFMMFTTSGACRHSDREL